MINDHEYDEKDVLAYIAAAISESTPIDYYTKFLKRLAFSPDNDEEDQNEQFKRLASYLLNQKNLEHQ